MHRFDLTWQIADVGVNVNSLSYFSAVKLFSKYSKFQPLWKTYLNVTDKQIYGQIVDIMWHNHKNWHWLIDWLLRRQLQKRRTKHIGSIIVRDSLRTELTKQRNIADDIRDKQEQLRIDIDVLNTMIGRTEEQMVHLRKRHEEETQKRNDR